MKICKEIGCDKPAHWKNGGRKGYCGKHRMRISRHGNPKTVLPNSGGNKLNWKGTPEERFWNKVDKSGDCWLWTGAKTGRGYGHILINGNSISAHRYSWEIHYGKIPENMCILHRCDNPICIKPEHLFLGTQTDNIADMDRKGRRKNQYS